jgi:hypothetical protein
MPKIYSAVCLILITLMVIANDQGFVLTSYLAGDATANKSANHYHK